MNRFKLLTLGIPLIFYVLGTQAQTEDPVYPKSNKVYYDEKVSSGPESSGAGSSIYRSSYDNFGTECNIYLNENWTTGRIEFKNGELLDDIMCRYNIYNQQIEYVYEDDTAAIGNPEDISKLYFDNKLFVYREFECENQINKAFLHYIEEGEFALYCFYCITYTSVSDDLSGEKSDITYYLNKRMFYSKQGGRIALLPVKRKAIISVFEPYTEKAKRYVKQNKYRLNNDKEIILLFQYMNEIILI